MGSRLLHCLPNSASSLAYSQAFYWACFCVLLIMFVELKERGVLSITGQDSQTFLQGLVTQDIRKASAEQLSYALLLTPKGKILYDCFIWEPEAGHYLLDCPKKYLASIYIHLQNYKLRAKVAFNDVSLTHGVYVSDKKRASLMLDPRAEALGYRGVLPKTEVATLEEDLSVLMQYHQQRIHLRIVDYMVDLEPERFFPLELGMEPYGVAYDKGCYVGQEVTARTHYLGTVRKQLFAIEMRDEVVRYQPVIQAGNKVGVIMGTIKIGEGFIGLVLLRADLLDKSPLVCSARPLYITP